MLIEKGSMGLIVAIFVMLVFCLTQSAGKHHVASVATNSVAGGISCYECSGYESSKQLPPCTNKVTCKESEGCFVSRLRRHPNAAVQYAMGCKLKTACSTATKGTAHVRRQTDQYPKDAVARWQENQDTASLGGRHQNLHSQSIASLRWQTTANGSSVTLNGSAAAAGANSIRRHHLHHHGHQTASSLDIYAQIDGQDASTQVDEQTLTLDRNSHQSTAQGRPSANNLTSVMNASAAETYANGVRHRHSHHHGQQAASALEISAQIDGQASTFHRHQHHSNAQARPSASEVASVVNAYAAETDTNGFRHRHSHHHGQHATSSLEASAQIDGQASTLHRHEYHSTAQGRPSANDATSAVNETADGVGANGFRHRHSQQMVSSINASAQADGLVTLHRHSHHNTRDLYSNVAIRRVHTNGHNGQNHHMDHGVSPNAVHLCDVCCFKDDCNVWNACQKPTGRQESIPLDVIVLETTPRRTDAPPTKHIDVTTPAMVMNRPNVGGYTFACQSTDPSSCSTGLCNDDFFRFFCPHTCGLCP